MRAAGWGAAALFCPLVLSLLVGNTTATIAFYAVAMVVDVLLFTAWLKRALEYGKRASRGETFTLRPSVQTRGIPVKH